MGHIIEKQVAQAITKDIKEAVDAIFAKHGLVAGKQMTNYGDHYKFTIEGVLEVLDNGINIASKEAVAYNQLHNLYDLPAGLLGKSIKVNGEEVTFIGLAPTRRKYPFVFRKADGSVIFYTETITDRLKAVAK